MYVLIYVRVSTDKQADKELSIPAQLHACRQYASSRGWRVGEEFIEPGASARTADRPELKRLLSRCRDSSLKVGAVIVHKLDRLARNLADHVAIRSALSQQGVKLASVSENLDESTSGQLVEHIMASLAEFYSTNLGEEVRKGMRQKVRQGGWPHKPPRGYITRRDALGRSRVEIDPITGPIVRRAFEVAAQGLEPAGTLRFSLATLGLTSQKGGVLEKNAVRVMLRNPFYCGRVHWQGEDFAGNHPPLVSPEQFSQVQKVLGQRQYQHRGQRSLLVDLARCAECGALMSAETHGKWSYYRCRNNLKSRQRCRAPFCNVETAHIMLRSVYEQLPITPALRQIIDERLNAVNRAEVEAQSRSQAAMRTRLDTLKAQALRLATALANATMEPDVYRLAAQPIKDEQEMLRRQLGKRASIRPTRSRLPTADNVWQLHQRLRLVHQRDLVQLLFVEMALNRDGIASYRLASVVAMSNAA